MPDVSHLTIAIQDATHVTVSGGDSTKFTFLPGEQGIKGDKGDKGDTGNTGTAGPATNPRGNWVSGTSYAVLDQVVSPADGAGYQCTSVTSGTTDPSADATHWKQVVLRGATGAAGSTGAKGDKGDTGNTGAPGVVSADGASTYDLSLIHISEPTRPY